MLSVSMDTYLYDDTIMGMSYDLTHEGVSECSMLQNAISIKHFDIAIIYTKKTSEKNLES